MKIRYFLYEKGFIKTYKSKSFVISVGNLTFGGTGKTPLVIYLAEKLKAKFKVVVISRGYKAKKESSGGILSDGYNLLMDAEDSGDEPFLIASKIKVPVIIGKNKVKSVRLAEKQFNPEIIILDDAFQHFKIQRNLDIVLLDYSNPFKAFLREPVENLKRADIIVWTRASEKTNDCVLSQPSFKSYHKQYLYRYIKQDANFIEVLKNIDRKAISYLKAKKVFVFSGLAKNQEFIKELEKNEIKILASLSYGDHYNYSKKDLKKIISEAKKVQADCILTSEKDYVKIKNFKISYDLAIVGVEIVFDDDKFLNLIYEKIGDKK